MSCGQTPPFPFRLQVYAMGSSTQVKLPTRRWQLNWWKMWKNNGSWKRGRERRAATMSSHCRGNIYKVIDDGSAFVAKNGLGIILLVKTKDRYMHVILWDIKPHHTPPPHLSSYSITRTDMYMSSHIQSIQVRTYACIRSLGFQKLLSGPVPTLIQLYILTCIVYIVRNP